MAYCQQCGVELAADASFCPECGTESNQFDNQAQERTDDAGEATEVVQEDDGINTTRAAVSVAFGVVVGAVVAFAFTNVGGAALWFLVTVAGVGYFLYTRDGSTKATAGLGMYIWALWMPLAPIIFYIPLAGSADTETARGAGQAIGSVFGMGIYGFIGLIIGLVLAVIGYFIRKGE